MVAALHLLHCAAQCAGRLAGLGDDGHQQVGDAVVLSQLDDLGSMSRSLTSSGLERNSRLMMMLLTQTDLPLPVLPAMSRWGILHRSATWPRRRCPCPAQCPSARSSAKSSGSRRRCGCRPAFSYGSAPRCPRRLAGDGCLHADIGHRQVQGDVVRQRSDAAYLDARHGLDFIPGDRRAAGNIQHTVRTPKLSSVSTSFWALAFSSSSAPESLSSGARSNSSMDGY